MATASRLTSTRVVGIALLAAASTLTTLTTFSDSVAGMSTPHQSISIAASDDAAVTAKSTVWDLAKPCWSAPERACGDARTADDSRGFLGKK